MIAATCVPWPNRSRPSPPVKSRVAITRRASASCRVSIPESITATVTPRPDSAGTLAEPDHTWSAPMALRGHLRRAGLDPQVPGQVIDIRIVAQRRQLAGGHAQHAAFGQVLLHRHVVSPRQRVHRRLVAVDDHVDRLRAGGEMVRQVRAQPRAVLGGRRGRGEERHADRQRKSCGQASLREGERL